MIQVIGPEDFAAQVPEVPWDFALYRRLLEALEAKAARIQAAHPQALACRAGCHHCCRAIPTLWPVEWAYQASLPDPPASGLESQLHPGEALCRRLDAQGLCSIYAHRPVICRTHGFVLWTDEGADACPWNWEDAELDEDEMFRLEDLNTTLLQVNLAFLRHSWPSRWRDLVGTRVQFHEDVLSLPP